MTEPASATTSHQEWDIMLHTEPLLAVAGWFKGVKIYNWQTGEARWELGSAKGCGLALSDDGKMLYHGEGLHRTTSGVGVYDLATREQKRRLVGPTRGLLAVALCSELLFAGCHDHNVYVWNVNGDSNDPKATLVGHEKEVYAVAVSETRPWLASTSADGTVRLWDFGQEEIVEVKKISLGQSGRCVRWDRKDDLLFAGGVFRGCVKAFSLDTFECVRTFKHDQSVCEMQIFEDERLMMTGDREGVVRFWDLRRSDQPIRSEEIHQQVVWSICRLSPSLIATVSSDEKLKISEFSLSECRLKHEVKLPDKPYGVLELETPIVASCCGVFSVSDGCCEALLELFDFEIACGGGKKVASSVPLLSASALVAASRNDDEVQLIGMPDRVEVDPEGLLQALLGQDADVPERQLFGLYSLFLALELRKLAYLACAALAKITDLWVLVDLCVASCPQVKMTDVVAAPPDGSEELEPFCDLSPFAESVLRRLKCLRKKIFQNRSVSSALSVHGYIWAVCKEGDVQDSWDRSLEEHPVFAGMDLTAVSSFSELFQATCARLYRSRDFSNLTLRATDGHEERVHLEIMMSRSPFFCNMFKFERGVELASLKAGEPVQLEQFSEECLTAYLSWIYLRKLPTDLGLRVLLRLYVFARMDSDGELVRHLQQEIVHWASTDESDEVILRLIEVGWLLFDLPDGDLGWFVGMVAGKLDCAPRIVLGIAKGSLELQECSLRPSTNSAAAESDGAPGTNKRKREREEEDNDDPKENDEAHSDGDGGWGSRLRKRRKKSGEE